MNYEKIYNDLIESRRCRLRIDTEYYERHHIKPRCFGGSDDSSNLVYLTFREHFIAHKLLFKFSKGKKKQQMGFALHRMCSVNNANQKYRLNNSRDFEKVKQEVWEHLRGENHPCYGKKYDDEFCKRASENQKGSNNSMFGKEPWNKGLTKHKSEKLKIKGEKLSNKWKQGEVKSENIGKCLTEEGRKRLSDFQKGRPVSTETRLKISKKLTGRKISRDIVEKSASKRRGKSHEVVTCPHCGETGGKSAMTRWHFDKCKHKDNINGK